MAMPARRAIASSPTNVSRQPAEPHLHGGPVGIDGDVAELAAEAVRAAEELAVDEDAAADADLAEDADEVLERRARRPASARRAPRGSTSFSARTARSEARQPGGDLVGDEDLRPAEVRRPEQACRSAPRRCRAARRRRPPGRAASSDDGVERFGRHPAEAVQDGPRRRAPVVGVHAPLVADRRRSDPRRRRPGSRR